MKLASFVEKQRYAINRVLTSGHLSNLFTLCVRQVIFVAPHNPRPLADNRVVRVIFGKIASAINNQKSVFSNQ